ncbi:glutamine--tRNA ligase/YqeY domain fusion protein [Paraliomyxa miuraensis]|uniref:glutamine--tRNA ligase/YqeY domain fusion protein n=1 Tax=Paraliomyxa miuraensis TaxID=376150 RepID=UPI002257E0E9|nr:glutamine--tRNA ligase/YqeY domain fusion protein [Paraliomyxa miuraensis]MCX4246080.1 glutamine--tRNA ligase/YqeY domain fusion protein [Paraliomyxa miuraensis]
MTDTKTETPADAAAASEDAPRNFVAEIVEDDLRAGKHQQVITRFPPEPNGYLHIGHAKAICLNFGLAQRFGGRCHLRFDDTNPAKEEQEYVDAIQEDIRWLGFDWGEHLYFASDYFDQLHAWAVHLIEQGKAYVDSSSTDQIRKDRGNFYTPGVESAYRNRSVEENLELFERMRRGELPEGEAVLRAKIDMASGNQNLRDPLLYRIRKAHHHRTGDKWCIYPMYDYAHGQSDAIEHITHSICTLEFEDHRPLYEWFLDNLPVPAKPRQIEFAKLQFSYTVLSKRRLLLLVKDGHVSGWDDPRMPTLRGLRRRGYPPQVLREVCERVGVAKRDGVIDVSLLEFVLREHLNRTAVRRMAVLRPLKLTITNWDEGHVEEFEVPNNPEDPSAGTRKVAFGRELYVEHEDFREDAPKKWFRLAPGREVRLRSACLVTCHEVVRDDQGQVVELRCTWDPESRGGRSPDGRKVKGTLHWVSAQHAVDAEVRLYDRLYTAEDPSDVPEGGSFLDHLNPESLEVLTGCKLEPALAQAEPETRVQFERLGYFVADWVEHRVDRPVFNRTIGLRDSWAKLEKKGG